MRALLFIIACTSGLYGCAAPLPTVGFGVRSTFRAREQPRERAIDVFAGVRVGWAGGRRDAALPAIEAGAPALDDSVWSWAEHEEPPCAEALLCMWERDERLAALARAGISESDSTGDLPLGVAP